MGNNPADDYFVQSHGVKTPDAFWKVVIRGTGQDERAIAWVVPNSKDATRKHLDNYLVNVDELEKITGEIIPVADYAKPDKPSTGCSTFKLQPTHQTVRVDDRAVDSKRHRPYGRVVYE